MHPSPIGLYAKRSLSIGSVWVGVKDSPSSFTFHVNILKISINDLFQYAFFSRRVYDSRLETVCFRGRGPHLSAFYASIELKNPRVIAEKM